MYRLRSLRTAAVAVAAAALVAPTLVALASPASAGSVKRHDVNIYKVEGFVELGGEYPDNEAHEHLYCEAGDYAIDGMWKVDSYETPNEAEGVYGDKRFVRAVASYADVTTTVPPHTMDVTEWHFRFANEGTGRATIKTFIVCLTPETGARAGHTHDISITRHEATAMVFDSTMLSPVSACPIGWVAVAPGFRITTGMPRLYRSAPAPAGFKWQWTFSGPGEGTFYQSCLKVRVSDEVGNGDDPTKPHTHRLDLEWMPDTAGLTTVLPPGTDQTVTQSAAWRDFAAVGAFDVLDPVTTTYLGQDARGRKRDFKFWNADAGNESVKTAILSLHKRTSPQLKP